MIRSAPDRNREDASKTRRQLLDELAWMRAQVSELGGLTKNQKETLDRVEQSERRFRALTDNALDSIALMDAEGRILYESPSIERSWRISVANPGGRTNASFVHPGDHRRLARNFVRSTAAAGRAHTRQLPGPACRRCVAHGGDRDHQPASGPRRKRHSGQLP